MNLETTCDTQTTLYQDALIIRRAVFIEEQQIPVANEIDELENSCLHTVLYTNQNQAVATARILPLTDNTWKIQRVAVLKKYRGQKIGQTLLSEIIRLAEEKNIKELTLNAQQPSIGFYESLDFEVDGEIFFEVGIPHQTMKRLLN